MVVVIICAVLALLGAVFIAAGNIDPDDLDLPGRPIGTVLLVFAVSLFVLCSWTQIGAKDVGVVTAFGKPVRNLGPGLHLTWPWQHTTEIDGTIQVDEYKGDDCIYVRIGDGSKSCLTATIRWRVNPDEASVIYGDYRSDDPTESLRDAVVSTQFKSAAQDVLSQYNPIAGLKVVEGDNAAAAASLNFAPDYDQIATDLVDQMNTRLGDTPLVEIQSITVSYLALADSTQAKLNEFIAAVGDTRIAAQRKSTAKEESEANTILSDSISHDPNVLVSKCLDLLTKALESDYALPAGFSCWGSSSAVVVPGGN